MYITKKYKKVIAKALKEKYNIVYSELNKFKTVDEIMDYTLDRAMKVARENKQLAIYDLNNNISIYLNN